MPAKHFQGTIGYVAMNKKIGQDDDTDINHDARNKQGSIHFFGLLQQGYDAAGGAMLFCFQHIDVFSVQREQRHFGTGNSKAENKQYEECDS